MPKKLIYKLGPKSQHIIKTAQLYELKKQINTPINLAHNTAAAYVTSAIVNSSDTIAKVESADSCMNIFCREAELKVTTVL